MNNQILKYFIFVALIGLMLFLLDRLFLWFEEKGWIYYRHKKSSISSGSALQSLNAAFIPSAKYVMQVQEENTQSKESLGDNKDF